MGDTSTDISSSKFFRVARETSVEHVHYCKNAGANLDWSYYSKTQAADLQKSLQKLSLGAVLSKKD